MIVLKALLNFIIEKLRALFSLKNKIENRALESGEEPKDLVKEKYKESRI